MRAVWAACAVACAAVSGVIVVQAAPVFLGLPYEGQFGVMVMLAPPVAGAIGAARRALTVR